MNYNEYWKAVKSGLNVRQYDFKSRSLQKSLKYNQNPNATTRHHLMNTPEQIAYNNTHYELWGFEIDENGNEHFEYGKYIIFVTNEEHLKIHHLSEETRKKISIAVKARWNSTDYRLARSKLSGENSPNYGKHFSSEHRKKISESNKARWDEERRKLYSIKFSGENNPNYGKPVSNETKLKLSEAAKNHWCDESIREKMVNSHIGKHHTEETKKKLSEQKLGEKNPMWGIHNAGENAPMYGKTHSDETKNRMKATHSAQMKVVSLAYREYKLDGGTLTWNEFQVYYNKVLNVK